MFPGMNPGQMAGMMKKMGIAQTNLPVRKVIFEMDDGNLVIKDPSVLQIKMQGQTTFQVSGEAAEETVETISEEDVQMVMSQTGKDETAAKAALAESEGDIAEAIMNLKE